MITRMGQILALTALALVLAFLLGCGGGGKPEGRSNLATKAGDREVKASLDGAGFISSDGNTAVISFAAGKLVVEKKAVRLDEEELAKLPEEAKLVEVDYTAGKLTVTADGKSIVSKEIRE